MTHRKAFLLTSIAIILCSTSCRKDPVPTPDPTPVPEESGYADGYIRDEKNLPCAGVSVSDGFSVAVTDDKGYYKIAKVNSDARYIFYSIPEYAAVTKDEYGRPAFFTKFVSDRTTYDFTLTRQDVEKEFLLFALADPQAHYQKRSPQTTSDADRFKLETVPAINKVIQGSDLPCYGVTLGDIVYSEGSRDSSPGMPVMRTNCAGINMPLFQTMGNHDFTYFSSSKPLTPESGSSLYFRAQRSFEECFGPVNHSFNRGNVHVVCMRNINYDSNTDAGKYHGGFTDNQYEWLRQDLANVPKGKMVILCVHIPIVGLEGKENVSKVLSLLKQYTNSTIFSGHTHYYRGVSNVLSSGMFEHVHNAVCGQWWWSNIEGDGCPNGYTVYKFSGTSIKDAWFMGVNGVLENRNNQIRIYKGDLTCGGTYAYFKWPFNSSTYLINVFQGDSRWTVRVFEDGIDKGIYPLMANSRKTYSSVSKGVTYTVPTSSSQDWWAIGYHIGVLGRGTSSTSYYTTCRHMYKYVASSPTAKIEVEATDPYGNVYTCKDVITTGTSYPFYVKSAH